MDTKRTWSDVEEEFQKSLLIKRLHNSIAMQKVKDRIWKRIQNTISNSES
jgi:hypothetical protein